MDRSHPRWGVPAYDEGLFSRDPAVNPVGEIIEGLSLTNTEFGPALTALIVDRSPNEVIGPIDFCSLSVREFGTIYEGLLESELSVAETPLAVDSNGVYLPAREGDTIEVEHSLAYRLRDYQTREPSPSPAGFRHTSITPAQLPKILAGVGR